MSRNYDLMQEMEKDQAFLAEGLSNRLSHSRRKPQPESSSPSG